MFSYGSWPRSRGTLRPQQFEIVLVFQSLDSTPCKSKMRLERVRTAQTRCYPEMVITEKTSFAATRGNLCGACAVLFTLYVALAHNVKWYTKQLAGQSLIDVFHANLHSRHAGHGHCASTNFDNLLLGGKLDAGSSAALWSIWTAEPLVD